MDRRGFLGIAGGALVCTIGGQPFKLTGRTNMRRVNRRLPVPPKVAAAKNNPGVSKAAIQGNRKEYWIQAEPRRWDICPSKRDQMMGARIKQTGGTRFNAYVYRAYTPNFGEPIGPPSIPGPLLDATVGDTLVVHFRNRLPVPVTMHPHGAFYSNEMDGSYKGWWTDPGGFVQQNRTFTYIWECVEGTQGTWIYHDHGPLDPFPIFKGLFGHLIIRDPDETPPDVEHFITFHNFSPTVTNLRGNFHCINGRAYTGNTPNLRARVGDDVAMHVVALDNDFHTFHLHGHRWKDGDGTIIDNKTIGPADSYRLRFTEDNPGRWLYHCHVFSHLHNGMSGWYIVE